MKLSDFLPKGQTSIYLEDGRTFRPLAQNEDGSILCHYIMARYWDEPRTDGKTKRERDFGKDFFPQTRLCNTLLGKDYSFGLLKKYINELYYYAKEDIIPTEKTYIAPKGFGKCETTTLSMLIYPLGEEEYDKFGNFFCNNVVVDKTGIRRQLLSNEKWVALSPKSLKEIPLVFRMKDVDIICKNYCQGFYYQKKIPLLKNARTFLTT